MTSYSGSASGATAVDLSRLPFPDVIEPLSFEAIVTARKALLLELAPELEPVLSLPADPLVKFIEACSYRELNLRARVNDAASALTLAKAVGADLDHLVALLGVARLQLTPPDPETGAPAVMEDDEALRRRALLAPDSYSVAGPAAAYVYHAMSAHGGILDASAHSPDPGEVVVTVLGRDPGPLAPEILAAATAAVTNPNVRPLTDLVLVQAAELIPYQVKADLTYWSGPDAQVSGAAARARLQDYIEAQRRLGRGVARSGLIAALHPEGVRSVDLIEPAADIPAEVTQAASCALVRIDGELAPPTVAALAGMTTPPSPERVALYDQLFAALIMAGVWPDLAAFYLLAAHNGQASRVNLCTPGSHDLVAVNSPSFTPDVGATGDGVSSYYDTGLSPSAIPGVGPASLSAGAWMSVNPSPGTSQFPIGSLTGDETLSLAVSPSTGSFSARVGTTSLAAFGSPGSTGHFAVSRTKSTHVKGFRNGALVSEQAAAFTGHGTGAIGVLRRLSAHHSGTVRAAWVGRGMSDTKVAALHSAINAYLAGLT